MVIKRDIADKHPWAVLNLLKAFKQANDIAENAAPGARRVPPRDRPAAGRRARRSPRRSSSHGIAANRTVLETIAQYSLEQGLTPRLMKLEELFAPSTMSQ